MRALSKVILKGLVVAVPFGVTLYVVWWLGDMAESILAPPLQWILPATGPLTYWPGMGLLLGLAVVVLLGLLTYTLMFRKVLKWVDGLFGKAPLVKSVYGGLRDMMDLMSQTQEMAAPNQVVAVDVGSEMRVLGFITEAEPEDIPDSLAPGPDCVVVYLPMSYQIGGYAVVVPRERVRPVDMSIEDGMRYALTAGMGFNGDRAEDDSAGGAG